MLRWGCVLARGSPGRENVRPRKSESCCPRPVIGRRRPHLHALCPLTIHTCRASTSSIHQHDTIKRRARTPRARPRHAPRTGERQAAGAGWAAHPLSSSRSVGARMKTSHMMSGPPPHPARHRRRRHSHRRRRTRHARPRQHARPLRTQPPTAHLRPQTATLRRRGSPARRPDPAPRRQWRQTP